MLTDADLLRRYAADYDERVFADLVKRHIGLVYAGEIPQRIIPARRQPLRTIRQSIHWSGASRLQESKRTGSITTDILLALPG